MSKHTLLLHNYISNVRRILPCSGSMKKRILCQLRESVSDYLSEHPDADLETLENRFGTPGQIASGCVEANQIPVLVKKAYIGPKVLTLVSAALLVVMLSWFGYLTWCGNIYTTNTNGRTVDIVEYFEFK